MNDRVLSWSNKGRRMGGISSIRWLLLTVAFGGIPFASPVAGHLVAYWDFNEAKEGEVADLVGGSLAVIQGTLRQAPGYKDASLEFDGNSGYVRVARSQTFDIVHAITIAAWIKVATFDRAYQTIIAKGDGAWRLSRDTRLNTLQFAANNGQRRWVVNGHTDVNDGKWHHVVGVFDGAMARLYIDGRLDASLLTTVPIQMNDYEVCIGENSERPGRFWNGWIDEVLIFNHALREGEISQLHRLGAAVFLPETLRALRETVNQAEARLRENRPEDAIRLVERGMVQYQQACGRTAGAARESERLLLSDLYFLLAGAKDLAGASKKEVTSLYATSALLTWGAEQFVPALLWLYRSASVEACRQVIEHSLPAPDEATRRLPGVARAFQERHDWAAFELFLRTAFTKGRYGTSEMYAVLNALGRESSWGRSVLEFSRREPVLWPFFVQAGTDWAKGRIQQGDFLQAAQVYRDIAASCPTAKDAAPYRFRICECMYQGAYYEEAIREIDRFVAENAAIDARLARMAVLRKGRAQMHLQQVEQAFRTLETLARTCPEAERAEVEFYLACGKLSQGDRDGAEKILNAVAADPSAGPFVARARLYLATIRKKAR